MALPVVKGIGGYPLTSIAEASPILDEYDKPTGKISVENSFEWTRWFTIMYGVFPYIRMYTVTFNPTAIAANDTSEQTVTVSGVETNDIIIVNKPTMTAGIGIVGVRASASGTVAITFMNATGSSVNPAEESYEFVAIRK